MAKLTYLPGAHGYSGKRKTSGTVEKPRRAREKTNSGSSRFDALNKKPASNKPTSLTDAFLDNPLGTIASAAKYAGEKIGSKIDANKLNSAARLSQATKSNLDNSGGKLKREGTAISYKQPASGQSTNGANKKQTANNTKAESTRKTWDPYAEMAQRKSNAQASGKGTWDGKEEMRKRREKFEKEFGKGKGR